MSESGKLTFANFRYLNVVSGAYLFFPATPPTKEEISNNPGEYLAVTIASIEEPDFHGHGHAVPGVLNVALKSKDFEGLLDLVLERRNDAPIVFDYKVEKGEITAFDLDRAALRYSDIRNLTELTPSAASGTK